MKRTAVLLMALCGVGAVAQDKPVIPVGVDLGIFLPSDTAVKDTFGHTWWRIGLTPISFQKPEQWKFTFDVGYLRQSRSGDSVTLIPVTFGVTRAFGPKADARPYIALRAGPYWGDVNSPTLGVDTSKVGLDANAAVGLTLQQKFYIEARYDYFSPMEGIKFNGFFFSAGVRLFEIKL